MCNFSQQGDTETCRFGSIAMHVDLKVKEAFKRLEGKVLTRGGKEFFELPGINDRRKSRPALEMMNVPNVRPSASREHLVYPVCTFLQGQTHRSFDGQNSPSSRDASARRSQRCGA
jgi:hypothetical protein